MSDQPPGDPPASEPVHPPGPAASQPGAPESPQWGAPQPGGSQYGPPQYGPPQYGGSPYGGSPYGGSPYGGSPYGAPQYGAQAGGAGWPTAGPPPVSARDRVGLAWGRRAETDYIFSFWTALGWTILTLGIYGFYVFYQLVRRMRDHNARRLELFDAAITFAWEEAVRRGLQEELTPSFQRAGAHLAVMRQMTSDFREPAIWLVLEILAAVVTAIGGTIVQIVAFILLDQDLIKHDRAEIGVEFELALIYGRFGQQVPPPDQGRVKASDNYAGRIVASIFSLGIYMLWWYYNQMEAPNGHFRTNWPQEDALANAVHALGLPAA